MYYTDYHMHSTCSPDGHATIAEHAEAAIAAGLSEICITDHVDLLDWDGNHDFSYDWNPIRTQLAEARNAVGNKLVISFGIELGEPQASLSATETILAGAPDLDFVLGSFHNLSEAKGAKDLYFLEYGSPDACYEVLDDYFASILELSTLPYWDSLSHLIYPLRYMVIREHQPVSLDRYHDTIDTILNNVISSGRAIEINSHCGNQLVGWDEILVRYRELGGELITTGSDAHRSADVGGGIQEAVELLRKTGYHYYTVYRNHKPQMIKIN